MGMKNVKWVTSFCNYCILLSATQNRDSKSLEQLSRKQYAPTRGAETAAGDAQREAGNEETTAWRENAAAISRPRRRRQTVREETIEMDVSPGNRKRF